MALLFAYLPLWYGWRAVQLSPRFPTAEHLWSMLAMLPFGAISTWWARAVFESLPETEPKGCFIVTAARKGIRDWWVRSP